MSQTFTFFNFSGNVWPGTFTDKFDLTMNVNALHHKLAGEIKHRRIFPRQRLTRDTILQWAREGGFDKEYHVAGEPSIPSMMLGETTSFACWTGTLNLVSLALSDLFHEWGLELGTDKFVVGIESAHFPDSNPEGGDIVVEFSVADVVATKVAIKRTATDLPATRVRLNVRVINTRGTEKRIAFVGKLVCLFSDIPQA